jgi:site-specific recombinase XerD
MDHLVAINQFLAHRRGRNRSIRTIEQYHYQLIELWHAWIVHHAESLDQITLDHLLAYFDYLRNGRKNHRTGGIGLSAETIGGAWRTLRAFWRYCHRRTWLTDQQALWFSDDELLPRPHVPQRIRPVLADEVLHALLCACSKLDHHELRYREHAIILILAQSGMRIGELVSMRDSAMRLDDRAAIITSKGGREDWAFWGAEADSAIRRYLRYRGHQGDGSTWLRLSGAAMTVSDVRKAITHVAELADVTLPEGASVHCFRHRYAHKALDSGLDISQVSQLMRHRDIDTTMRYLREHKDRLKAMHDRVRA